MNTLIEIIVYGLSLFLALILLPLYMKKLSSYIEEVVCDWPNIPNWLNWVFGVFLFLGCLTAQDTIFFESIVIWLVLLIIVPFFYLPIRNSRTYNILSVTTFFLTAFFSVTLFFNIDNSRDLIGKSFIPNYKVYYTTEYYQTDYVDKEVKVTHVNTGNKTLDFVLESIFPFVYRSFIGLIEFFSLLTNLSLRKKNKLIKNIL